MNQNDNSVFFIDNPNRLGHANTQMEESSLNNVRYFNAKHHSDFVNNPSPNGATDFKKKPTFIKPSSNKMQN